MIEIWALFRLCKSLGNLLRNKGYNPLSYQIFLLFTWFTSEFIGALFVSIVHRDPQGHGTSGLDIPAYCGGLLAAGIGGYMVLKHVHSLPSKKNTNPETPPADPTSTVPESPTSP